MTSRHPHHAITAEDRERRTCCATFISGVEEAVRLLEHTRGMKSMVCTSFRVASQALVNHYMTYAARHRERMHEPAVAEVIDALREVCPCSLMRQPLTSQRSSGMHRTPHDCIVPG